GGKGHCARQMVASEQVWEGESSDESSNLTEGCRDAMCGRAYHHREDLSWVDKSCHVRTKLGEEVAHTIHKQEWYCQGGESWCYRKQSIGQSHHSKPKTLNPPTSQAINRED